MSKSDHKIAFAISPDGQGDGVPVVILGVPVAAWEYMKDGKTHTFDLTSVGVPVKLLLFGATDHAAAVKTLNESMKQQGLAVADMRGEDFTMKPKPKL